MKKLILLLLLPIILLGFDLYHRTYLLMGTFVEITLTDKNDRLANETIKSIRSLEDNLSIYKKGSDIQKINELKKGRAKTVSKEVYEVLERAIYFSKLTDGAFDITVSPLLKLWKFEGGKFKEVPSEEKIKEALLRVGWENITLNSRRQISFKKDGMSINLGGIAKGYIVDKTIEYLKRKGVKSAIINAGGDVYCLGKKDSKEPWNIGIRHPRNKKEIIGTLMLADKAIATSGDYEKFFMLNGKRFSHIINPKTGYPADNCLVQVTVVADTCIKADALTTALMVMGKEKGLELIEKLPGTEAVIIEKIEGKLEIIYTSGLKESININENQTNQN